MSDNTARLGLPEIAQMQEMTSAQINDALLQLDALCSPSVLGLFVNDPPASPTDGDTYITGGAPTGIWAGSAYKIAYCVDGGWRMFTPFDGLMVHRADSGSFVVHLGGQWVELGTMLAGPEVSIASATTCDLGAAGGLRVQITGATTITSLGTGVNAIRLVRFAGSLTLTHNAAGLILPGGIDIVTRPGDCATFTSDGSGNWRCRSYARADGHMVNMDSPTFTGTVTGPDASAWSSGGFDNASSLKFGINGTQVVTINASGIGWGATPSYPLHVHTSGIYGWLETSSTYGALILNCAAGGSTELNYRIGGVSLFGTGCGDGDYYIYNNANPVVHFSATGAGATALGSKSGQAIKAVAGGSGGVQLASGATAWAAVSERHRKKDFIPVTNALECVCAHKVELWRYKTDPPGAPLRAGLFYEDAEKWWPVAAQKDTDGHGMVANAAYVPLLMAGVQALEHRILDLEEKLARREVSL